MKTGEAKEVTFKPEHQLILINNKPPISQLIPTKGRRFIVGDDSVSIPDSFYEGLKHLGFPFPFKKTEV